MLSLTIEDLPNPGDEMTTVYLKSDGASLFLKCDKTWGTETTLYIEMTRQLPATTTATTSTTSTGTTGTSLPLGDSTLLLILGGAGLVVVVLGLIIIRRR